MIESASSDPLAMPKPENEGAAPGNWEEAEFHCQGFPRRFLDKCRELREALEGHKTYAGMLDDLERQMGFVIRNLLDVVENCRPEPTTKSAQPDAPADQQSQPPAGAAEQTESSAAGHGDMPSNGAPPSEPARQQLESARRSLVYVLEELGVRRVELLGQTYDGIVVDGRKIFDPFEVLSSTQSGKATQRVVSQVVTDLWVDRDGRVVKKGLVIC